MTETLPLARRLGIVTQKRDDALAAAFDAQMEIEGATVQTATDQQAYISEKADVVANCTAAATRFNEILAALEQETPA